MFQRLIFRINFFYLFMLLQSPEAMRQIESAALEDQLIDWVVGKAKVTAKAASFSELTGFGQNAAQ